MKRKVGLLVAGLLAVLSLSVVSAAKFSDVPPGHWAEEAVYKLADEGIILGFPDGTFRGNEYLTRYQAALLIYRLLERLRAEMRALQGGVDQETLAALRNAVQELAAELASLGVRVSALEDNAATKADVAKLLERIQALEAKLGQASAGGQGAPAGAGMDMAALKDLEAKVAAALAAADAASAKAEAALLAADSAKALAEANADSIKALNELAVMLNQDVLSLQDRVAALEKEVLGAVQVPTSGAQPAGYARASDIKALTEYVQALSGDVAGLAGKLSEVEGKVSDLERNAFKISGKLSLTYQSVSASGFANRDVDRLFWKSKNVFSSGDGNDNGEKVDEPEGLSNTPGETKADLSVKFQTGKLTGTSKGEGLNVYNDLFQFSIKGSWTNPSNGDGVTPSLVVDSVKTTLGIAEGQTLSLVFGRSVNGKYTEYLFDNDKTSYGHGIVAKLNGLPLGTQLTFAYGNHVPGAGYDYFYAGHVAISPTDSFSLGATYIVQDAYANPVWGLDGKLKAGPVCVKGEYFSDANAATSYYVMGKASFGAFELGASYRNIADIAGSTTASGDPAASDGKNGAPFAKNQSGFGVKLGAGFGLIGLSGTYQNYTIAGTPTTYMEGKLTLAKDEKDADGNRLATGLAGFFASALYSKADGSNLSWQPGSSGADWDPATLKSGLLAQLKHFGDAPDATIKGLNFTFEYGTDDYDRLNAYGDYTLGLGPADVFLLGGYFSSPATGKNTVKYGLKLETDPFALPLKPAFAAGYVGRSTSTGSAETKWFAGVKFTEFLFPHSEFRAAYSVYSAKNVASFDVGEADKAFVSSAPYLYTGTDGGVSDRLFGFMLSWTYYDLTATFMQALVESGGYADAFRIAYTVEF